jgi:hypothetical protein
VHHRHILSAPKCKKSARRNQPLLAAIIERTHIAAFQLRIGLGSDNTCAALGALATTSVAIPDAPIV